ncbi:MAG: sulfatase-like hydrolase/transferase [Myxococcota bacterium]
MRSGWWMRMAALWGALIVAKACVVALRVADGGGGGLASWLAPLGLLHEDALTALAFSACDGLLLLLARRSKLAAQLFDGVAWPLLVAIVAYSALNVPVARVLSTPLTYPMLAAVGGALGDSITRYLTPSNLAAMALVVAAAPVAALAARRLPARALALALAITLLPPTLFGAAALRTLDTFGLHRSAVATLLRTTWRDRYAAPPLASAPTDAAALPAEGPHLDLRHLEGAARGKSVIWVVLESTGARFISPWGTSPAGHDPMPNLTRLMDRALVFDSAYAAYPESIKGLWSYLCGAYPVASTAADRYTPTRRPATCAAAPYAAEGYATALFHSGRFVYLGMRHIVDSRGFDVLKDAGDIGGQYASSFGTDDASTARALLDWLAGLPEHKPFFAFYMPIAGHHPYRTPGVGPRPFPQATERDAYINDLFAGDAALGALYDGIAAAGLADDVVWVIMGDHGEAFAEHEGNLAHSLYIWEENVHVPLAFVLPGALSAQVRAPQITSLIDVLPTLAALTGVAPAPDWQGQNRLQPKPGVARFYTDHGTWQMGLRQDRWKYILDAESGRGRLYDLQTDPAETKDLAADHPERAAAYEADLRAWHASNAAHFVNDPPAPTADAP